jgi:hypothetical protein
MMESTLGKMDFSGAIDFVDPDPETIRNVAHAGAAQTI